jgi:hypothetical protein
MILTMACAAAILNLKNKYGAIRPSLPSVSIRLTPEESDIGKKS